MSLLPCPRQTSHGNFSESTDAVKALTPEEKEAKLARMKAIIAERRAARGEEEKVDHVKVCVWSCACFYY